MTPMLALLSIRGQTVPRIYSTYMHVENNDGRNRQHHLNKDYLLPKWLSVQYLLFTVALRQQASPHAACFRSSHRLLHCSRSLWRSAARVGKLESQVEALGWCGTVWPNRAKHPANVLKTSSRTRRSSSSVPKLRGVDRSEDISLWISCFS